MPLAFAQSAASVVASQKVSVHIEPNGEVKLVGKLTAISGTNLTLASWGGNWSVDASNATIVRRANGDANLSGYQVGDMIAVHGKASMTNLSVVARTIKNESVQKKERANFIGVISNLNASSTTSFTLTVKERGALTIMTNASTTVSINGQPASSTASLANGMFAQITGVWDGTNSTVIASSINAKTAVSVVEDVKPGILKKIFHIFGGKGKAND